MDNKDKKLKFAQWFFLIGLVPIVLFSLTDFFWSLSIIWLPIIVVVVSGGLSLWSYNTSLTDFNKRAAKRMFYFNVTLLIIDLIFRLVILPNAISNVFF